MSLTTPERVWNLQQSLQAKAKANPSLRFYSLYDKIYRRDVLTFAYQRCRANDGSAGVDGQSFEQIESAGLGAWLDQLTEQPTTGNRAEEVVAGLNRKLRGWANYFSLGPVSKAYRAVDSHTRHRLRQWLCKKHKQAGAGTGVYPDEYLYEKLCLLRLETLTANLPWAKV